MKLGCKYCEDNSPEPGWIETDNNGPIVPCPICNRDGDKYRAFDRAEAQRDYMMRKKRNLFRGTHMSEHTPGPWTFESYPFGHKPRVFGGGRLIAEVGNAEDETLNHDRWIADARMMAAALELLEAATAFDANLSEYCDGPERDALRAAIAKATGVQTSADRQE